MHNQKGFIGCSNLVIIFWVLFMLAFGGFIILNKNLFHVPKEKHVLTSPVAARRCRQKLEMFKTNHYIRSIVVNELEINSVIHDEFAHGQHEPLLSLYLDMKPGKLEIEAIVIFIDLFPQTIRSKLIPKTKKERENNPPRKVVIKLDCRPVIEEGGNLFINPRKLVIGKQNIPLVIIKIIDLIKPDWFNYPVSEEIASIAINKQELEIVKRED